MLGINSKFFNFFVFDLNLNNCYRKGTLELRKNIENESKSESWEESQEESKHYEDVQEQYDPVFPPFTPEERDENVPDLRRRDSEDSMDGVLHVRIFTHRRDLIQRKYHFRPKNNFRVMRR